jgi:hypothetical protein
MEQLLTAIVAVSPVSITAEDKGYFKTHLPPAPAQ